MRDFLGSVGVALRYFNGGGSGSIEESAGEEDVTEVAAGSGFLQSHLFDYFVANENQCAFCYGLRVTRIPCPGMVTCQGGVSPSFLSFVVIVWFSLFVGMFWGLIVGLNCPPFDLGIHGKWQEQCG